jgi:3-methylfumaryl-CoA hydratase
MSAPNDISSLRAAIGKETRLTERVDEAAVARFEAVFDRQGKLAEGDPVPLLFHFCLGQPVSSTALLGPDGHPAESVLRPPATLPRRMWAGGEVQFHHSILVGQSVTRRTEIEDVVLKEGQSGALCFVTVRHRLECEGMEMTTERQDIVYRAAEVRSSTPRPQPTAPEGVHRRAVAVTAPLLFRYSAVTFNAHRIHYDLPYAREKEGYPGLVVHGPLQATLLCQYAAELVGTPPSAFAFRSRAPIFGPGMIMLHALDCGDGDLKLWVATDGGPVAMDATASWS